MYRGDYHEETDVTPKNAYDHGDAGWWSGIGRCTATTVNYRLSGPIGRHDTSSVFATRFGLCANCDTDFNAFSNCHGHPDTHAHTHGNCHGHRDIYAHTQYNANGHRDIHAHGYADPYANAWCPSSIAGTRRAHSQY